MTGPSSLRLHLAHEGAGDVAQRLRTADPHDDIHGPGDDGHDPLHDAEMVEDGHQRADQNNRGRDVEGEDEAAGDVIAGFPELIHDDAAVDETRALPGELLEFSHDVAQSRKEFAHGSDLEDEERNRHLQPDAGDHQPPIDLAAVVGEQKGEAEDESDAKQAM